IASGTITQPAAALAASSTAPAIACFGGSSTVTVSATGGTPPYSGTGPFANQAAGPYSFTVTDANGCTSIASGTITQPAAALAASSTAPAVACFGSNSTVTVSAAGATAPYSGTGGFANQADGAYHFTVPYVTGRPSIARGTITQPAAALAASAAATDALCYGSNG